MGAPNVRTDPGADRAALDRALAAVAEERFRATVDAPPRDVTAPDGHLLTARVAFAGGFSGTLSCTMPRALARELAAMVNGAPQDEIAVADPLVDDLAGEFVSLVCGRWLTDVAAKQLFSLSAAAVEPAVAPGAEAPRALLKGRPIWIELTLEG